MKQYKDKKQFGLWFCLFFLSAILLISCDFKSNKMIFLPDQTIEFIQQNKGEYRNNLNAGIAFKNTSTETISSNSFIRIYPEFFQDEIIYYGENKFIVQSRSSSFYSSKPAEFIDGKAGWEKHQSKKSKITYSCEVSNTFTIYSSYKIPVKTEIPKNVLEKLDSTLMEAIDLGASYSLNIRETRSGYYFDFSQNLGIYKVLILNKEGLYTENWPEEDLLVFLSNRCKKILTGNKDVSSYNFYPGQINLKTNEWGLEEIVKSAPSAPSLKIMEDKNLYESRYFFLKEGVKERPLADLGILPFQQEGEIIYAVSERNQIEEPKLTLKMNLKENKIEINQSLDAKSCESSYCNCSYNFMLEILNASYASQSYENLKRPDLYPISRSYFKIKVRVKSGSTSANLSSANSSANNFTLSCLRENYLNNQTKNKEATELWLRLDESNNTKNQWRFSFWDESTNAFFEFGSFKGL